MFLRPFAGPGRAWRVSPGMGTFPFWRADNREIFFVADGTLSGVTFDPGNGSPTLGTPARLFPLRGILLKARTDGRRFLVASLVDPVPPAAPLTIIVNWAGVGTNGAR